MTFEKAFGTFPEPWGMGLFSAGPGGSRHEGLRHRVRVVTTEEPSRLATGCAIAMAIPLVLLVIVTILGGLRILLG
jgi:hypothetical protein